MLTSVPAAPKPWHDGLAFLLIWLCCGLYAVSLWGRFGATLPWPLGEWLGASAGWLRSTYKASPGSPATPATWAAWQFFFAGVIPTVVLAALRRHPGDVGAGWPNVLGRRLLLVGVLISIPFGLWIVRSAPHSARPPQFGTPQIVSLLTMIPEHYLLCGTCVALLLAERRLPRVELSRTSAASVPAREVAGPAPVRNSAEMASPRGGVASALLRPLQWLGLAQSAEGGSNRLLGWFGLTGRTAAAVVASGVLFGLVHVGKPNAREVLLSFPGGVLVAYVTLRARSIWPAILSHWAMNLIPLGLRAVLR